MSQKPPSSLTYESIFQTIVVEERPAPRWQNVAAAMAD